MLFWYINFIDIEKMFDSIYCRVKKNLLILGWFLVNIFVFWVLFFVYGGEL